MLDIIIPYFNSDKNLFFNLLESLKKQTIREKINLIIVDDNSYEKKFLKDSFLYKENFKSFNIYVLEETKGPGFARNYGFLQGKSKYVMFIDSDDEIPRNDSLEILINSLEELPQADFSFGYHIDYKNLKQKETILITENLFNTQLIYNYNIFSNFKGCIYRRKILEDKKIFFNESFYCEEFSFLTKIILNKLTALFIPIIAYKRNQYEQSMTYIIDELSWMRNIFDLSQLLHQIKDLEEIYNDIKKIPKKDLENWFYKIKQTVESIYLDENKNDYFEYIVFFYLKIIFNILNENDIEDKILWEDSLSEFYKNFKENTNFVVDDKISYSMDELLLLLPDELSKEIEKYKEKIIRPKIYESYLKDAPWNNDYFLKYIY